MNPSDSLTAAIDSLAQAPSQAPIQPAPVAAAPVAAPAPIQSPAPAVAPISSATPIHSPAPLRAVASTPTSAVAPRPVAPQTTAVAQAPATSLEPLTQRENSALQIDVKRDQVTSSLNSNATSIDGEMVLTQGIQLAGTHYGLNIISLTGVVVIPEGAKILPSANRPSRIIAQKIIIAGEAVIERLQGDELVMIAPGAQTVIAEIVYGKSFVAYDGAKLRVTRAVRQLTPRERRVSHWYEMATSEHMPANQSGYEAFCRQQDAEIEADMADSLVDAPDDKGRPQTLHR